MVVDRGRRVIFLPLYPVPDKPFQMHARTIHGRFGIMKQLVFRLVQGGSFLSPKHEILLPHPRDPLKKWAYCKGNGGQVATRERAETVMMSSSFRGGSPRPGHPFRRT